MPSAGEPFADRLGQFGIVKRQDAVGCLDHGDLGAEFCKGDAEFQSDVTRADNGKALRNGFGDSASVEEITEPPNGIDGSSTGTEPVAITTVSARITCVPVSVSTSTVFPSRNFAKPWTDLTLAFFKQAGNAVGQPADDAVLPGDGFRQVDCRARTARCRRRSCPRPPVRTASNSSAAWISALEGMQPMVRQVPPGFFASTMTVSMPSCPARIAQT